MEPALLALAGWLQEIGLARWASASPWVYPWANVAHIFGVVMLVGGIGIVDLRTVGIWRRLPLPALSRALTPVAIAGLLVQLASGLILFAADGPALAGSGTFQAKLALIVLGLSNAIAFRYVLRGSGRGKPAPLARVSAAASLALWLCVATLGRLIAYY